MPIRVRLLTILTAATLAATITASACAAATLEFDPAGAISMTSLGSAQFAPNIYGWVECDLTLQGELESEVSKVTGEQVGEITEVEWANCSGGALGQVLALPWSVTYDSILGTLPESISGILVVIENAQIRFSVIGLIFNCLFGGDIGVLIGLGGTNPYRTGLGATLSVEMPYVSGPEACPDDVVPLAAFDLTTQTITRS